MGVKLAATIGLTLVAVLIGVDIYLVTDSIKGNTWSELLRAWSLKTPLGPWAIGVLSGHFFHPINGFKAVLGQPDSIALLIWLTALVGMVGLGALRAGAPIAGWVVLLPAFIAGWLLWPV